MFKNTLDNKRYHTLNYFFKKKFGQKVFKVPLDINSICPNQASGGCIYCSNKSVASISDNRLDILEQFENGRKIMEQKWPNSLYIPYFQSGTNTYNDKNLVKGYVDKLLMIPKVVGIDIATRPDCLSDEWLDYLEDLNKKTFLIVELGLQSSNDNTLRFINRGHDSKTFKDAVDKLHERNIFVVAHIIDGLPYETKEDMINTIKFVNDCKVDGIKIHMLYIAKNTPLASLYETNKFHILTREEYIDIVCSQLRFLNEDVVVMRITGDPELNELVAPEWLVKKFMVLNGIDQEMAKRNIYQGDLL
ncbi:TIGR01212 family radical SAM protein [bacterium]|nr:TIGR01212 family radical SAM protein [bacterium]